MMKTLKLSVTGEKQTPDAKQLISNAAENDQLVLEQSIIISNTIRGLDAEKQTLEITNDHLVELVFDDDTTWLCPPDALEEIYPGSLAQNRDGEVVFELPSDIEHPDSSRSLFGKIALKVVNLFTKKAVAKGMRELANELEAKQLGDLRGLVRITKDFSLVKPDGINTNQPCMLFIHGTNSSTAGSFAELKSSPLWDYLTAAYGNNILALQHETLTKSPLQNVVDAVNQLPANVTLNLITHSRGGLVGEIFCRFSGGSNTGFSDQEISYLDSEKRADDIACIQQLQKLCPQKKFLVNKFIRVASPSSGTSILSKRLDHFFNVSLNLFSLIPGFAANPIYIAMKSLLVAVIDQKNDPKVLPGLEAMKPDSPFITALNNQNSSISLNEAVLAITGSCKTKLNLKALVIIASKLFFTEDNDLVVNTKSMYNGSKRLNKLQYFFDEDIDVDHFHYFKNSKTNAKILLALQSTNGIVDGFTEFSRGTVGEAERNAVRGLDGGEYSTAEPTGTKPIVILLPGIMGSSLSNANGTLWIDYLKFLTGGLGNLALDKTGVKTSSIIKTSYKKLGDALLDKYDVVTFAFDWRLSLEEAANHFNDKINSLLKLNQPIKIIGHSMGGVLVRDFMVYHPDTWKLLNASAGFRLLFLGSPLGGSYRINNVLFGEDDIIKKLSKIDIIHTKKRLVEMFDTFPGILCLLPLKTDDANDFSNADVWNKMKDCVDDAGWPLPSVNNLNGFKKYRDKVLKAISELDYSNAVYIAGQYKQTPCGYRIDETVRGKELVFLSTAEGDQSVTWEMGIPKPMIDAGKVYYVNYSHGALSNSPEIFNAIKEILERGETSLISKTRPSVRGDQKVFKKPSTEDFDLSPEGVTNTLLGLPEQDVVVADNPSIKVSVSHGDLKYATYPVLAGHFKNDGVLYAEARVDKLLNGILSQQHKLSLYPGPIGTNEVHLTYAADGFQGAIIIGLDEPGVLTGYELSRTVELSIERHLLKLINKEGLNIAYQLKQPLGISSLIIGSSYGGLSVENSVSAILQGIINANNKISNLFKEKAKQIECVEFIELYENTALTCMYALNKLAKDGGGMLNISIENRLLNKLSGARKQVLYDNTYDWWNRITITKTEDSNGNASGMRFSISTSAAREDLRTVSTCTGIVEGLMQEISTDNNWSEEKARAIFELLVPNDFKGRLQKHGNIIWVLDKYTAGYPWELLQDKNKNANPLSINSGMIRQMVTTTSRINIESVPENTALVIGDPDLKGAYPQLPGAYKEAAAVTDIFNEQEYNVKSLLHESPGTIVPALVSADYRIIHLAGHGIFSTEPGKPSGMVLGKNSFITTAEIAQMSSTPELVFVNCCYLGKTDGVAEELFQERFRLAANIGTQLIDNGVKAVIVAGWAVDDAAALAFATKFYEQMFEGNTFGNSVRAARESIYHDYIKKNTWGAYQTYGDPFYKLQDTRKKAAPKTYLISEQAVTDLSNLLNDISTGDVLPENAENRRKKIIDAVEQQELRTPEITEAEAFIYKALNDYESAIKKFEQLLFSENASYSFIAAEQYCNLKIKYLITQIDKGTTTKQIEQPFDKVMADLQALIQLNPSAERYNLLASAWKRKIYFYKSNKSKAQHAVEESAKNYKLAYSASKEKNMYAYINWITMQNILAIAAVELWDKKELDSTKTRLQQLLENVQHASANDYWQKIIASNIKLCLLMLNASGKQKIKASDTNDVVASYIGVWKLLGSLNDKRTEIQHLDNIMQAVQILSPDKAVLTSITTLRNGLNDAING